MTHIEHTVTIARRVEDVWAYVMDARNDPEWMTNVIEVGRGAGQPVAVGLEIEETVQFHGIRMQTMYTITEHDPPHRSAIDALGPAGR
jgi:uncharacterized protein YndB with AHSA1/START domain